MRAPEFWGRPASLRARALAPLGEVYGRIAARRLARLAPRADLPTIVVGGLTLGGDGKTPTVMAFARILQDLGERPIILTRGYLRASRAREPILVDVATHLARDVGDEALLLGRVAPTIVGADRIASARLARSLGATALVLDDGFHSRALASDLAALVVDAHYGAGNGYCPPAGPLRAPLGAQIARADVIVAIGEGVNIGADIALRPLLRARLTPSESSANSLSGARVLAFAGIGRPEKFFRTLNSVGAQVVARKIYPDHYAYRASDLHELRSAACRLAARLVTTEKDMARIAATEDIETLSVSLEYAEPEVARQCLMASLAKARGGTCRF